MRYVGRAAFETRPDELTYELTALRAITAPPDDLTILPPASNVPMRVPELLETVRSAATR